MRSHISLAAIISLCSLAAGCHGSTPESFVLVVLDTTRADAISTYGEVEGTTPTFDRLARSGLLYENAFSNANWTVPSHASIFTGLLPHKHGILTGREKLKAPTLAETLRAKGYETAGFSENPWLALDDGLKRGFDTFRLSGNAVQLLRQWVKERKGRKPFFLFVNLMDAHAPYKVRKKNLFLPPGVTTGEARAVDQSAAHYVCAVTPQDPDVAVLRGLYLGGVHAADAKLAVILKLLGTLPASPAPVLIVTADHGEYLGEHWRISHATGVGEPVVHVPLVIHGLPGAPPAKIKAPVQLVDILPSILTWVHAPLPSGLAGEVLPTSERRHRRESPIVSEYHDYFRLNGLMTDKLRDLEKSMKERCGPDQRLFGDMTAIIRYPEKFVWYSKYTPQLFDLDADPLEQHDLSERRPRLAAALQQEVDRILATRGEQTGGGQVQIDPAVREQLRALGYFDQAKR
jgi:arylsulfatase A-like enzyme